MIPPWIDTGAISIVHAIEGCKASEGRRVHDPHEPLRHAVLPLTVSSHLPVRPRLRSDPSDDRVKIPLFIRPQKLEDSFGTHLDGLSTVFLPQLLPWARA